MGRSRVLSFISQLSGQGQRDNKLITPSTDTLKQENQHSFDSFAAPPPLRSATAPTRQSQSTPTTPVRAFGFHNDTSNRSSPFVNNNNNNNNNGPRHTRSNSRPMSMVQTYHPPLMDVNEDTIPELQPIFTFLNNHANKLYQEGYFLKLDDQDNQGRPNPNRTWTEYFAQLVGTVLSLWDATELDQAGEDGEVLPKFINLTDASIQMIESLPTRSNSPNDPPLQNILSISTAGRNRYLLHFNSHHSLIQWTAGIRLAMYEQVTLQEAYTGALIAGRGKTLNNINVVMERMRQKYELWVRVRFGAGTPWRRCWCVVSPPDEKEYQKRQKEMKKRSPYDRSHAPILKGDIRFYNTKIPTKKLKKATPLAAITDAYSAYAIYPQAKSLIDASTLVKVEGTIKYYLDPPSSKEGFVFIMPEVPPAVSGFEMLLRFLFPTWDTFALYGRPGRLVASVLDQRSLMFAMPKHKRYGYLEILDITGLILEKGSNEWNEREWRKRLKALTGDRMAAMDDRASYKTHSRSGSRRMSGSGSASGRPRVGFADDVGSVRTGRSHMGPAQPASRTDSAPPANRFQGPSHSRNSSDLKYIPPQMTQNALGHAGEFVPSESPARGHTPVRGFRTDLAATPEGHSSDEDQPPPATVRELPGARNLDTPEPAPAPPAFAHAPSSKPAAKPYHSPELRRANSRLSHATLAQMAKLRGIPTGSDTSLDKTGNGEESPGLSSRFPDQHNLAVHTFAGNPVGMMANANGSREVLTGSSNAGIPRSNSPLGYNTAALQIATSDSRGYQSPPDSRSNSLESPKTNNFSRPFTPPVMTSNQPALRLPPPPIQTNQPVPRKPLPQIPTATQSERGNDESTPLSETSIGSFYRGLDVAALDKVHPPQRGTSPLPEPKPIFRQDTQRSAASSQYDDASTESPSYASTIHSEEPTLPVDRPRAGVLRTVGDANHDTSVSGIQPNDVIPEINFGPTFNLAGPLGPRTKTPTSNAPAQRSYSPAQKTPPLDKGHYRQGSEDTIRRNVAWQPGASSAGISNSGSRPMSPELYVQQRAQNAATPLYSHQRQPSGNTLASLRMTTPTPPLNKFVSHEPATQPSHSRSSSSDLLHRQSSQSTQLALGMAAKSEVSAHLSAREQEQVARMTGTSLIQGAGHHQAAPRAGLVGAIAQREKEKEQMKQGFGNQAVQHAISQRQQVHTQQMYQQQIPQQPQMYGISDRPLPSAYASIPQQGQPRQQYGAPPAHYTSQVFTQNGGYGNPNMRQQDQLGPRLMSPSQGQYSFGTPQGQGGRGYSSGPQFQGQTY